MSTFKTRHLHRQRRPRRKSMEVMTGDELAACFGVPPEGVVAELERRGLTYHTDSTGRVFASVPVGVTQPSGPADEPGTPTDRGR